MALSSTQAGIKVLSPLPPASCSSPSSHLPVEQRDECNTKLGLDPYSSASGSSLLL